MILFWCLIKYGILIGYSSLLFIWDKVNFCKFLSWVRVFLVEVFIGVINFNNDFEKLVVIWLLVKVLLMFCGWFCFEIILFGLIFNVFCLILCLILLIVLGNCVVNVFSVLFKLCFIKNVFLSCVVVILRVWG